MWVQNLFGQTIKCRTGTRVSDGINGFNSRHRRLILFCMYLRSLLQALNIKFLELLHQVLINLDNIDPYLDGT